MTPKLCQICGCERCIIPKDINIDLNIFRTRLVKHFQHMYVVRHIHNSLCITTSASQYKYIVFPDGGCLHDTIKYEAHCITCLTIKPDNMINIKCDLGFCDECTE